MTRYSKKKYSIGALLKKKTAKKTFLFVCASIWPEAACHAHFLSLMNKKSACWRFLFSFLCHSTLSFWANNSDDVDDGHNDGVGGIWLDRCSGSIKFVHHHTETITQNYVSSKRAIYLTQIPSRLKEWKLLNGTNSSLQQKYFTSIYRHCGTLSFAPYLTVCMPEFLCLRHNFNIFYWATLCQRVRYKRIAVWLPVCAGQSIDSDRERVQILKERWCLLLSNVVKCGHSTRGAP